MEGGVDLEISASTSVLEAEPAREEALRMDRRTLREEAVFWIDAFRLILSLAAEYVFNIACGLGFIFFRNSCRDRMRRIVLGKQRRGAACCLLLALLAVALSGASGCAGSNRTVPTGDSRTFQGSLQQLRWSLHAMADQSDSRKSLEEDLDAFRIEKNWKKNLRFDAESLFLMPDAKKSLEWDLEALSDSDFQRHGLKETFLLLGW